jgi:hypothetical protein
MYTLIYFIKLSIKMLTFAGKNIEVNYPKYLVQSRNIYCIIIIVFIKSTSNFHIWIYYAINRKKLATTKKNKRKNNSNNNTKQRNFGWQLNSISYLLCLSLLCQSVSWHHRVAKNVCHRQLTKDIM